MKFYFSENMTKQIGLTLIGYRQAGARRHQAKSVESINHNKEYGFDSCLRVLLKKPLQARPGLHFGGCPLNLDIFSENVALTPGKHPQPLTN